MGGLHHSGHHHWGRHCHQQHLYLCAPLQRHDPGHVPSQQYHGQVRRVVAQWGADMTEQMLLPAPPAAHRVVPTAACQSYDWHGVLVTPC